MANPNYETSVETGAELVRLLQDIERRSKTTATDLPQHEELQDFWEGLVFSVAGKSFVAPLSDIKEILNYPSSVTTVPGTKSWVRGIANIRGNLLPIIDLQAFLGGLPTVPKRRSRVLVIACQGGVSGLLVDEMVGTRHFSDGSRLDDWQEADAAGEYVRFAFEQDGNFWPVFSMEALAENERFKVAAR